MFILKSYDLHLGFLLHMIAETRLCCGCFIGRSERPYIFEKMLFRKVCVHCNVPLHWYWSRGLGRMLPVVADIMVSTSVILGLLCLIFIIWHNIESCVPCLLVWGMDIHCVILQAGTDVFDWNILPPSLELV